MAAVVIALNGIHLLRPAIQDLMDHIPGRLVIAQIECAARSVEGVRAIEKVRVRKLGTEYFADLHVQAGPSLSLAMRTSSAARSRAKSARRFPRW